MRALRARAIWPWILSKIVLLEIFNQSPRMLTWHPTHPSHHPTCAAISLIVHTCRPGVVRGVDEAGVAKDEVHAAATGAAGRRRDAQYAVHGGVKDAAVGHHQGRSLSSSDHALQGARGAAHQVPRTLALASGDDVGALLSDGVTDPRRLPC